MSEGTDILKRADSFMARIERVGKLIRDLGFPIFVAVYFLLSLGPKVDRMEAAVTKLVVIVERVEARK